MEQALKWDSAEWRRERDKKLAEWIGEEGAECVVFLSTIAETWDDLVDKDKEVSTEDISQAFILAMIRLDLNPFWVKYKHILYPVVVASVNAWLDSEELRKINIPRTKMMAFFIRNFSIELIPMAAFCVGGFEYMRSVSLPMRRFFEHETYYEWEHRHA